MLRTALALWLLGAVSCTSTPQPAVAPEAAPRAADARVAKPGPLHFLEDDFEGAARKARDEHKLLFVDAWAPWCHTCLSMKNFVLSDPSLGGLADRVVFLSIDTDRPEAATFLEHHTVKAWPTFFVLDPAGDKTVGYWAGSASLRELRGLVEEALADASGALRDATSKAFAAARAAHASGNLEAAAKGYEAVIASAPATWPSRSAALVGWMEALAGSKAWSECVRTGSAHAAEVASSAGSSAPGDFASYLLTCASSQPAGDEQTAARRTAVGLLRATTTKPPADASVDDRQDALDQLSEGLEALGDAAGAKAAQEARARLLEEAANAAKSPEMAQTFDYARANTYVALGRSDDAIRMLEARERELPGSYEPPARLAGVLFKAGKNKEALAAVDRAMARAYGPRKLRYLKLRGDILAKEGDRAGALAARRDEVSGWAALAPGQASPSQLADAKKRLAEAESAAPR